MVVLYARIMEYYMSLYELQQNQRVTLSQFKQRGHVYNGWNVITNIEHWISSEINSFSTETSFHILALLYIVDCGGEYLFQGVAVESIPVIQCKSKSNTVIS
jgi:hypothetical protein